MLLWPARRRFLSRAGAWWQTQKAAAPEWAAEGGQGIEERGCALGSVPGQGRPGVGGGVGLDVPEPDGGVEPERERGGTLRAFVLPGL